VSQRRRGSANRLPRSMAFLPVARRSDDNRPPIVNGRRLRGTRVCRCSPNTYASANALPFWHLLINHIRRSHASKRISVPFLLIVRLCCWQQQHETAGGRSSPLQWKPVSSHPMLSCAAMEALPRSSDITFRGTQPSLQHNSNNWESYLRHRRSILAARHACGRRRVLRLLCSSQSFLQIFAPLFTLTAIPVPGT
jgi:hypothetical protein